MTNSGDFSILVPVYNNTREQVDRALASISEAGFGPDAEILLCDDGSGNGIDRYLDTLHQARVLYNGCNRKLIHTRNRLLEAATREWVVWLDADDQLLPGFLDTVSMALEREPAAGVVRIPLQECKGGGSSCVWEFKEGVARGPLEVFDQASADWQWTFLWGGVWSRKAMLAALPPDAPWLSDDAFYALPARLEAGCVVYAGSLPGYRHYSFGGAWSSRPSRNTGPGLYADMAMRRDQAAWHLMFMRRHGIEDLEVLQGIRGEVQSLRADMRRGPDPGGHLARLSHWFDADGTPTPALHRLATRYASGDLRQWTLPETVPEPFTSSTPGIETSAQ